MNELKIFLVRHAPVIDQKGMIYGDVAKVDLISDTAKQSLQMLAEMLPEPEHALWVHSGVERAKITGDRVLLLKNGSHAKYEINEGFREQDFGSLIGQTHDAVQDSLKFINGKIYAPSPPDGETIDDFVIRVGKALKAVTEKAEAEQKKSVVVFCHGGTIRAAHSFINRLDQNNFIELDTPPLGLHCFVMAESE